ncbi:AAA family ATPase [Pseudanabaena sp. FACHB-1277]|uniref:AAA family ATPase n=1 Tax=Pseudanabaena cinerea FACHB-1277 TaxID=2949581 RepID=A0A926Z6J5_9CYAN|nr:AAA family ATPase [Pseudanabaena cinerea]MBD2151221.1 AAA family ATPase [Pseudanabaena cinerea FACHB-1277]
MQIRLTIKNYRCFTEANPARITIRKGFTALIGINNSGKTTLLKFFYEFRYLLETIKNKDTWEFCLAESTRQLRLPKEIIDNQEIFCNANDRPISIEIEFSRENDSEAKEILLPKKLIFIVERNMSYSFQLFANYGLLTSQRFKVVDTGKSFKFQQTSFTDEEMHQGGYDDYVPVYVEIPYIEFADLLHSLGNTLYIGAFRNSINLFPTDDLGAVRNIQSLHASYFDINVGLTLIKQWRESKTGKDKELIRRIYALQNDIKRIFGFDELDINASVNDQTIQFVINNNEVYNLSELGAGLSQFFLVLANVAIKQPAYILIDEPELNLHPSLQLDFLTTLGNYASQGVIFSTHSIGLARASAEQIYVVRKVDKYKGSEIIDFDNAKSSKYLSEFLGELSFSAYREFGFNKVLLVEGVTEVKTIQQFLRKFGKDHEILLLPLGGGSLINANFRDELQEVKRISDDIYALVDSEKSSPEETLCPRIQDFADMCEEIGIKCHVLEYRATENYFPDHAVKAVKGNSFSALAPYESLKDRTQFGWSKADNWRIAKEMTNEELLETDLGRFIKQLIAE